MFHGCRVPEILHVPSIDYIVQHAIYSITGSVNFFPENVEFVLL